MSGVDQAQNGILKDVGKDSVTHFPMQLRTINNALLSLPIQTTHNQRALSRRPHYPIENLTKHPLCKMTSRQAQAGNNGRGQG